MKKALIITNIILIILVIGLSILLLLNVIGKSSKKDSHTTTTKTTTKTKTTDKEETFVVKFDLNGGTGNIEDKTVTKGYRIEQPTSPTKTGYVFDGWYYKNEKWSFIGYSVVEDMTLLANWTPKEYTLSLSKNNNDAGEIEGPNKCKYGQNVSIVATTNEGYVFDGWFYENEKVSTESNYEFTQIDKNMELIAKWVPKLINIDVDNKVDFVTITGTSINDKYDYSSTVTLTAENVPYGNTIKWTRSDGITYIGNTYTFNVPLEDFTITTTLEVYSREGDSIYFGYYPQTLEENEDIISTLNEKAGEKPSSTESHSWIDYEYYANGSISSYMWYIDIDLDEDGRYDYRGVYFNQYRPVYPNDDSIDEKSNQDNRGYYINETYWFKYEPIKWNVLLNNGGIITLISDLVLDAQDIYPSDSSDEFEHNGGTGYTNNYALSNIKIWLNSKFYNSAFNQYEKEIIESKNNDDEYIYLISKNNSDAFMPTNNLRLGRGTDYAFSQGLNRQTTLCSNWYTCDASPINTNYYVYCIGGDGEYYITYSYATATGVRPVIYINT